MQFWLSSGWRAPWVVAFVATLGLALPYGSSAADATEGQAAPTKFERDRQAILAMAGNFEVTFDFEETFPLASGYVLKEPKISEGHEIVRVIEDRGEKISLQHILVVGDEQKLPVKHWRQDWVYEPSEVLVYVGGNAWERRKLSRQEASGKWAQVVYQVDDSPRYGAVAEWRHQQGVSEWEPPAEWRPLPRRDATTRDDYHAIDAVNRHVITPWGWVHEQDNTKLVLTGEPVALVREIGVNTYTRSDDFAVEVGEAYWAETAEYWAEVREIWSRLAQRHRSFRLTLKGEPEELYSALLDLAVDLREGETDLARARTAADRVIADHTTGRIGTLGSRLEPESRDDS